jgi:aryl-alcohol dehydrogenase-like predicted oxidoreductase
MKISLGTAQFGLDYGVSSRTRVNDDEVKKILEFARDSGVTDIDTATTYGESEKILGFWNIKEFKITTKIPEVPEEVQYVDDWVQQIINNSLINLRSKKLKAVLLHRPNQLLLPFGEKIWDSLKTAKEAEIVDKIGYSIYSPQDLDKLYEKFKPDIVQLPINIFDKRFESSGWLDILSDDKCEVHSRSVFLQGLLLLENNNRPNYFSYWNNVFEAYQIHLDKNKLTKLDAALHHVLNQKKLTRVVVGVDSLTQFKEIIKSSEKNLEIEPFKFNLDDEQLLNPMYWKL